jgi:DNA-binding NarL/FixJ family response regulator
LAERDDVEVVGTAVDYDSVLEGGRRLEPDVVLMDVKMPPTLSMEGIQAAHVIKAGRPATRQLARDRRDRRVRIASPQLRAW